jgi:cytidine deaminase
LTPEQLGIPSGESGAQTEGEKWEELEQAAKDAGEKTGGGAAVRTEDGTLATGVRLEVGQSQAVHALELAVWKAFSEASSHITKAVVVADEDEPIPCGRCLQVVVDFSFDRSPEVEVFSNSTGDRRAVSLDIR